MTQNRYSILNQSKPGSFAEPFLWLCVFLIAFVLIGTHGNAQNLVLDLPVSGLQQTSFDVGNIPDVKEPFSFSPPELPIAPAERVDLVRAISMNNELTEIVPIESNPTETELIEIDFQQCEIPELDALVACDSTCEADVNCQQSCELDSNCQARPWIFWKNEQCCSDAGPVCCSIQERTANWRLSSMYLQGCMPSGYSLQRFIETVNHLNFHSTTLSSNGPVDRGGSLEDAAAIEVTGTKTIQQVSIDITPPEGELPPDHAGQKFDDLPTQAHAPGTHRLWCGTSFYWQSSLLNHQPLYFEDINLERHGFSHGCWQPLISGGLFFSRLPALPYLMTAQPPHETQFTLGETRPGNHACYVCERPPLRLDAAIVEAAAVTGLIFLIP